MCASAVPCIQRPCTGRGGGGGVLSSDYSIITHNVNKFNFMARFHTLQPSPFSCQTQWLSSSSIRPLVHSLTCLRSILEDFSAFVTTSCQQSDNISHIIPGPATGAATKRVCGESLPQSPPLNHALFCFL